MNSSAKTTLNTCSIAPMTPRLLPFGKCSLLQTSILTQYHSPASSPWSFIKTKNVMTPFQQIASLSCSLLTAETLSSISKAAKTNPCALSLSWDNTSSRFPLKRWDMTTRLSKITVKKFNKSKSFRKLQILHLTVLLITVSNNLRN